MKSVPLKSLCSNFHLYCLLYYTKLFQVSTQWIKRSILTWPASKFSRGEFWGDPRETLHIGYYDHSFQNSQKVAKREYFVTVTPDLTFPLKTTLKSHQIISLHSKLEKAYIPVPSILSPKALSILEDKDTIMMYSNNAE